MTGSSGNRACCRAVSADRRPDAALARPARRGRRIDGRVGSAGTPATAIRRKDARDRDRSGLEEDRPAAPARRVRRAATASAARGDRAAHADGILRADLERAASRTADGAVRVAVPGPRRASQQRDEVRRSVGGSAGPATAGTRVDGAAAPRATGAAERTSAGPLPRRKSARPRAAALAGGAVDVGAAGHADPCRGCDRDLAEDVHLIERNDHQRNSARDTERRPVLDGERVDVEDP